MTFKKEICIQDILQLLNVIVVGISAGLIIWQLRDNRIAQETMIELDRRDRALQFMARWDDEAMVNLRAKAIHSKADSENRHVVQSYLNFYEELSLAIVNNAANGDMCKAFFRNSLINTYRHFQTVIESGDGYPYLKAVYKRWQREPEIVPPLPFEATGKK
jgi:hypothetical protein